MIGWLNLDHVMHSLSSPHEQIIKSLIPTLQSPIPDKSLCSSRVLGQGVIVSEQDISPSEGLVRGILYVVSDQAF